MVVHGHWVSILLRAIGGYDHGTQLPIARTEILVMQTPRLKCCSESFSCI